MLCHRGNGSGIEGLPGGEQGSPSRLELVESTSDQVGALSSTSPEILRGTHVVGNSSNNASAAAVTRQGDTARRGRGVFSVDKAVGSAVSVYLSNVASCTPICIPYWKPALNFPAVVDRYVSAQLATEAIETPEPSMLVTNVCPAGVKYF